MELLDHETVSSIALGHPFVVVCHSGHRRHSFAVGLGLCAGMSSESWPHGDLDAMLWTPMLGNPGRGEQCTSRKGPLGTDTSLRPLVQTRLGHLPAWCCLVLAKHPPTCRQRCGHPRPVLSHLAPVNQASESCVLLFSEFPTICWSEVRSLQSGLTLLYSQRMVLRKNTSDSLIAGGHFFNPQFC